MLEEVEKLGKNECTLRRWSISSVMSDCSNFKIKFCTLQCSAYIRNTFAVTVVTLPIVVSLKLFSRY